MECSRASRLRSGAFQMLYHAHVSIFQFCVKVLSHTKNAIDKSRPRLGYRFFEVWHSGLEGVTVFQARVVAKKVS